MTDVAPAKSITAVKNTDSGYNKLSLRATGGGTPAGSGVGVRARMPDTSLDTAPKRRRLASAAARDKESAASVACLSGDRGAVYVFRRGAAPPVPARSCRH